MDEAEGFTALKLHHYVKPSLSMSALGSVEQSQSFERVCMCVCVCAVCLRVHTLVLGFMRVGCVLLVESCQIHTASCCPLPACVTCSEKQT